MDKRFLEFTPPTKVSYIAGRPAALHLRKCKLVESRSDGTTAEYIFDQSQIGIGAMADNDVVLEDDSVSRHHAQITLVDENYVIRDLDSTNGTFVNGVQIIEAYLKPGCVVAFGKTALGFQALDERVEIVPSEREAFGEIVGKSLRMREIFGVLEKVSETDATVVIAGETGTGKEVVARTLHARSARAKQPFVVVDCGAVPETLIESELFGHEKGSFTGALASRQGLFQIANGGTVFLDEIGELTLELQPKLLRALERREIRPVGANRTEKVDVRVLAATHRDLEEMVREGKFREDLFYRLSVVRLFVPPLRERREDIPLLAKHFLRNMTFNRDATGNPKVKGLSREALDALLDYHWPGNVRELLNVIERACSFADQETIQGEDLPPHIAGPGPVVARSATGAPTLPQQLQMAANATFKDAKEGWVSTFERDYIVTLLRRNDGNISHAAKEADIDRKYFRKLMKKYEIASDDTTL
jgi:DNA-binding NtrC family response regulator